MNVSPKTNKKSYAGEGIASLQSGDRSWWYHNTTLPPKIKLSTASARRTTELKHLCYGHIVGALPPSHISRSFDYHSHGGPYLLPKLPHVSASLNRRECDLPGQFAWYESISGVGGVGTISLAQRVLKLHDWRKAAWRIAKFCEPDDCGLTEIHPRFFNDHKAVLDEVMGRRP
jgi:hypothetical protein